MVQPSDMGNGDELPHFPRFDCPIQGRVLAKPDQPHHKLTGSGKVRITDLLVEYYPGYDRCYRVGYRDDAADLCHWASAKLLNGC